MISIIVPIYNVECYVEKCISSLLEQTYTNIEIILVDDGSTDSSGVICDNYSLKDNRIIVIHQTNQGVSSARNAGLNIASGKYVGFCDPDDYVTVNMYQRLHDEMENADAQLAICQCISEYPDGRRKMPVSGEVQILDQIELIKHFWDVPGSIRQSACNKLFLREICNHIRFNQSLNSAEDGEYVGIYLQKVRKAVFLREPLYVNYQRPGSATRGALRSDSVLPSLIVYRRLREIFRLIDKDNEKYAQAFFLSNCLSQYRMFCCRDINESKEVIEELRRLVVRQFPSAFFNSGIYWKSKVRYFLFGIGMLYK